MNRLLSVIVLALAIAHPALADQKSHRKLAGELLTLMDVQSSMEQVFTALKRMQLAQLEKMEIPPEASEAVASFQAQLMELMAQEMTWDKMREDYVTVYVETFSEQELNGILGFYKSPAGKAFLKKTPEMLKRTMELSHKQMERIAPKIEELRKKVTQELEAPRP